MADAQTVLIVVPHEDVDPGLKVRRKVIYPLEPAIAATILKQNGYRVHALDMNREAEGPHPVLQLLENRLHDHRPDIVVVMSQHLSFLIKDQQSIIQAIAATVNGCLPAARLILAGTTPTLYPQRFFDGQAGAHVLFRGEIEDHILELIGALEDPRRLGRIAGACYRDGGAVHIAPEISVVPDLDALPIADRGVFGLEPYFAHPETGNLRYPEKSRRFTQVMASRGCSTGCTFCKVGHLRRRYRWRSVDHVMEEIRRLVRQDGIEEIHFLDENLLLRRPRAQALLERIVAEDLRFDWFCGGGMAVYMLTPDLLKLMKRSGCYRLHLAIESGSQRILTDIMQKPVNIAKAMDIVRLARRMDFEIIGYFMIGLPTETRAEILRTVELAQDPVFDYVVFSIYTPEEGTALYRLCRRSGWLDDTQDLSALSKRAATNLRCADFDAAFLAEIRSTAWQQINFGDPGRKAKLAAMFGSPVNGQ
jgi:radical SAM superfamily enzyme YgiQ (UPF0313 family)